MEEEKYEFVEEVIKKRPNRFKGIFSRLASWIGLAVVFMIGVAVIIFLMRDNLRELLQEDEKDRYGNVEKVSLTVSDEEESEHGLDMTAIRERIDKSVVTLKKFSDSPESMEVIGTGVILSKDTDIYVLANYNKVQNCQNLVVEFCDGSAVEASVWNGDKTLDIVTIKVYKSMVEKETLENIRSASISNADWLKGSYACIYEGNSFGSFVLAYEGKIAGLSELESLYDIQCRAIYTDIMMNNVNDGFLFDYNGGLTGIVINKVSKNNNGSISVVAVYDIYQFISGLLNQQEIGYLGIYGKYVDSETQKYISEEMPKGLYILSVDNESTAYSAGIMKGDIITEMDGEAVSSMEDVEEIILSREPGERISITLMRRMGDDYEAIDLEVELGKRKEG